MTGRISRHIVAACALAVAGLAAEMANTVSFAASADDAAAAAAVAAAEMRTPSPGAATNAASQGSMPQAVASPSASAADVSATPANATAPTNQPRATNGGEASLAQLLGSGELDYGKGVRCIPSRQVQNTEVLSQNLIVFRDRKHIWVNQIAGRCPQLAPEVPIALEQSERSHHCNLDIVRVLRDDGPSLFGGENISVGPACMLGKFEPISRAQLDVLREHFTPHSLELEKHVLKGKAK